MTNKYAFRFVAWTPVFEFDDHNRVIYSTHKRGKRIIRAPMLCEAYAKLLRLLEKDSRGKLPLLSDAFCLGSDGWYKIDNAVDLLRLAGYAVQESRDA